MEVSTPSLPPSPPPGQCPRCVCYHVALVVRNDALHRIVWIAQLILSSRQLDSVLFRELHYPTFEHLLDPGHQTRTHDNANSVRMFRRKLQATD